MLGSSNVKAGQDVHALCPVRQRGTVVTGDCDHCGGSGFEPNPEDPDYVRPNPSPAWDPQPPACRKCDGHGELPDPCEDHF
jgi:hypothetical protein